MSQTLLNNKNFNVSIIMSVFNDEKYLRKSIQSILDQTYEDFEFIILNDGSIDNSLNIINEFAQKDERIVFIDGQKEGLTKKLNLGIKKSSFNFIARQDSDDISHKDRLMKQIEFFKANPDYALCGTFAEIINNKDNLIKKNNSVYRDNDIKKKLNYSNIFIHPSVMINKSKIYNLKYDERYSVSQDYDLWTRIIRNNKCYIIPKYLIKNRRHKTNISKNFSFSQEKNSILIGFLYKFNLELPKFKIDDTAKSFDQIISHFSSKDENYKEDLIVRKYVYLYKIIPTISILRFKMKFLRKIIVFYYNKPSMLFKRLLNLFKN